MKALFLTLITVTGIFFSSHAQAQAWRVVFQPQESLDFYVAQNASGTYAMVANGNQGKKLFLRVTNDSGKHSRFYFAGRNYLQIDVPLTGYIALMSEDASQKIQYIHASQKVQHLKFTDAASFFKAASGNLDVTELVGQKVSPKVANSPVQVSEDRGKGRGDTADEYGFDPNRKMRSIDPINRKHENQEEQQVEEGKDQDIEAANDVENKSAESKQAKDLHKAFQKSERRVEALTTRVDKLRKTIEALQGELDNCNVVRKNLEIGEFNPVSFIAGGSMGYFNMSNNNEADTLEKITGLPVTLDIGVSFNGGRFHKAIMLSAGVMPVNMTPMSYVMEPVVGMKTVFMAKKYAVSVGGLVTTDMSYMNGKVGFGVWVLRHGILMAELGGTAGDVNLLYTKQVTPSAGLSFIYNFRKPKK